MLDLVCQRFFFFNRRVIGILFSESDIRSISSSYVFRDEVRRNLISPLLSQILYLKKANKTIIIRKHNHKMYAQLQTVCTLHMAVEKFVMDFSAWAWASNYVDPVLKDRAIQDYDDLVKTNKSDCTLKLRVLRFIKTQGDGPDLLTTRQVVVGDNIKAWIDDKHKRSLSCPHPVAVAATDVRDSELYLITMDRGHFRRAQGCYWSVHCNDVPQIDKVISCHPSGLHRFFFLVKLDRYRVKIQKDKEVETEASNSADEGQVEPQPVGTENESEENKNTSQEQITASEEGPKEEPKEEQKEENTEVGSFSVPVNQAPEAETTTETALDVSRQPERKADEETEKKDETH